MYTDLLNIGLAFIEGFALIISPCILPILPIILAGSLTGNKARPLGIITGFITTFAAVTLFSRAIIQFLNIDPIILRNVSFGILILLGIIMMSTYLTDQFARLTNALTSLGNNIKSANDTQSGFWGGLIFGMLIGIIWTPCAGPILAAIIVQVATQQTNLASISAVIAFAIGAGIPMFIIAVAGRKILEQFDFFRTKTILFRKILGLLIILGVLFAIYSPSLTLSYSTAENNISFSQTSLTNPIAKPYPAPQIEGITAWINSPPLTIANLHSKVVLIDFWTYSCINCIRTLPYLKTWYNRYHDQGFEIIGIHSPEFEFEKNIDNVKNAVSKFGIRYPVALDNNFVTWRNFNNRYWPAHYLIDKNGNVVYQHFGEGQYAVTENNIRFLLGLTKPVSQMTESTKQNINQTPETYLGYARIENFASPETIMKNQLHDYSYPSALLANQWALQGKWIINSEKIIAASPNASIKIHFNAAKVYAVMGMEDKSIVVNMKLNNKEMPNKIIVNKNQLYTLVNTNRANEGELEVISEQPGLEMYTFTFG